jgi:hyaluronan synthase
MVAALKRTASWRVGWAVVLLVLISLGTYRYWAWTNFPVTMASVYFAVIAVITVLLFVFAARGFDRHRDAEPVNGRIIAVIPTYNEADKDLHAAIQALLDSTIVPDHIHVVDDGSDTPATPFIHPLITWHRQKNQGKRAAQITAMSRYSEDDIDFVVTVDSDSQVAPTAIEDSLRAFNDRKVQAVTSVVIVRNRTESIFTRLSDLEIVSGIFVVRRARAAVGAVTPTSGAFSVYRSAPFLGHLYDYMNSGTFSDDRRLAHYCLMRGKVVTVPGAVVDTGMPATAKGTWRQRVRWYKGYWKYLPWEVAHLRGWALAFRYLSSVSAAVFPFAIFWVAIYLPLTGKGFHWQVFALWLALLYAQGLTYLRRPSLSFKSRLLTWLFLTPLLIPFQLLIIRPSMYWAAITVSSKRWDGDRAPGPEQHLVLAG